MSQLTGAAFDRRYAENELAYHQAVNGLVAGTFIPNIEHPEVKALFETAIVIFKAHEKHAEKARRCFQRFLDHNLDPKDVEPKFTDTRPTRGIGFPMIAINTAQELRDSIGLADAGPPP